MNRNELIIKVWEEQQKNQKLVRRANSQNMPKPKAKLSEQEHRIVHNIRHNPGITQKELADILSIRPQSLSDVLLKLEDGKIIRRDRNKKDRRAINLYLTDDMAKHIDSVHAEFRNNIPEQYKALNMEELKTLLNLLQKLNSGLE